MNIKKLFSVAAVVTFVGSTFLNGLALAATPDTELGKAYEWAHSKGITTMDTYEAANMDKPITRAQMAKMLSVYAMSELGMKPDTTKTECNEFNDIANITGDLHEYIITSCQLGLMGQQIFSGIKEFRPNANISRAEFGTALSRTLWGGKYEGGTPYYANHLQALQSAGIMKIIANAETTQEIRGYVMLMLMRSAEGSETKADCEDPMIKAACLIDDDSCPAECKASDEKEDTDTVVKSGDLAIVATASEGRKAIINGTSDLDTITLKASEDITLNSVTVERYGYSTANGSVTVWLEDSLGNVISSEKTLTSKDEVKLTIKKDYKQLNAKDTFTIVASITAADEEIAKMVGGTLGFKVTDVDSSAKNVNLDNYTPYEYTMINYTGTSVKVELKGKDTTYNYSSDKSFEVARVRVSALNSDMLINGFNFTNKTATVYNGASKLDLDKYVDKVIVLANGEELNHVSYTTKKDELNISFDDFELASKKNATFVVEVVIKDLDKFGEVVKLELAKESDIHAQEKKTGVRASIYTAAGVDYTAAAGKEYKFNGGKITLSSESLGSVEAAAGSTDVVVGRGKVELGGGVVELNDFTINVAKLPVDAKCSDGAYDNEQDCEENGKTWAEAGSIQAIDNFKIVVNGDDFEGTINANKNGFVFKDVRIEKSGKIEFVIDIANEDVLKDETITFNPQTFKASNYATDVIGEYDDGGDLTKAELVGSVSLSNPKITAAKANLKNSKSQAAEFVLGKTTKKTVFEGTYTAKKNDVYLNEFIIEHTSSTAADLHADNEITFYLSIDGKTVADDTIKLGQKAEGNFSDTLVKAGESVSVKIEAEVAAYSANEADDNHQYKLTLKGVDKDGVDAGIDSANLAQIKIKNAGSITVSNGVSLKKDDVVLRAADVDLANFIVEASNNTEGVDLTALELHLFIPTDTVEANEDLVVTDGGKLNAKEFTVEVDNDDIDIEAITAVTGEEAKAAACKAASIADADCEDYNVYKITSSAGLKKEIPSAGFEVKVSNSAELPVGEYKLALTNANNKPLSGKVFNRYIVGAKVSVSNQTQDGDETVYKFAVETYDSSYEVKNLVMSNDDVNISVGDVTSGQEERTSNHPTALQYITTITYNDGTNPITISYDTYKDYFKIGNTSDRIKVYKAKS